MHGTYSSIYTMRSLYDIVGWNMGCPVRLSEVYSVSSWCVNSFFAVFFSFCFGFCYGSIESKAFGIWRNICWTVAPMGFFLLSRALIRRISCTKLFVFVFAGFLWQSNCGWVETPWAAWTDTNIFRLRRVGVWIDTEILDILQHQQLLSAQHWYTVYEKHCC